VGRVPVLAGEPVALRAHGPHRHPRCSLANRHGDAVMAAIWIITVTHRETADLFYIRESAGVVKDRADATPYDDLRRALFIADNADDYLKAEGTRNLFDIKVVQR